MGDQTKSFLLHHASSPDEGSQEDWCEANDERSACKGVGKRVRVEAEGGVQVAQYSCKCRNEGGQENGSLRGPRLGSLEDPHEASNQGWQKRNLRQARHGEGQARQANRQSLPGGSIEEEHLKRVALTWQFLYSLNLPLVQIIARGDSSGMIRISCISIVPCIHKK